LSGMRSRIFRIKIIMINSAIPTTQKY
jgi:hypothetical protein